MYGRLLFSHLQPLIHTSPGFHLLQQLANQRGQSLSCEYSHLLFRPEDLVGVFRNNTTINRCIHDLFAICKIGGSQRITVHTARRSCVTGLADFGVNIYTIQRVVGHARLTTTQKYIQLSTAAIEADLRKAFPRDCEIIIPEAIPLPPELDEIK